jgi:quinoprotein glucose dehydrogenase
MERLSRQRRLRTIFRTQADQQDEHRSVATGLVLCRGDNANRYGFNPLVVGNTMIAMGRQNSIVALDATTGKELWLHDNHNSRLVTHHGINYWENKDRSCRRLLTTVDNHLIAHDFNTGKQIETFGDHGSVDLREGLGRDPKTISQIRSGTPGRIFENLLILGSARGEEYDSPPGDLRAYDVVTGKLVWQFHTVPHPGEMGYDTWPKDACTHRKVFVAFPGNAP